MKNTLGLLISLIILGGFAYYLMQSNPETQSTLNSTGVKFTIDKEEVDRVLITRKSNNNLDFTREGQKWKINGKYYASPHTMSHLLNTMSKIDMIFIPYKTHYNTIVSDMKKIGIHVEAFDKSGNKIKGYTIGANSAQNDATYFLLDGDNQPYAMNIKGFDGTIRDRFNYHIENWKDKTIFDNDASEISTVKVVFPKRPSASFVLTQDEGQYSLTPGDQLTPAINKSLNKAKVEAYLHSFKNVIAEGYDNRNVKKDSISNLLHFVTFDVALKDGKQMKYKMIPFRDVLDPDVNISDVKELEQVERYFVTNEETGDFLVLQQRLFKDLLRSYEYFY